MISAAETVGTLSRPSSVRLATITEGNLLRGFHRGGGQQAIVQQAVQPARPFRGPLAMGTRNLVFLHLGSLGRGQVPGEIGFQALLKGFAVHQLCSFLFPGNDLIGQGILGQ
jgi:hypothetical protein